MWRRSHDTPHPTLLRSPASHALVFSHRATPPDHHKEIPMTTTLSRAQMDLLGTLDYCGPHLPAARSNATVRALLERGFVKYLQNEDSQLRELHATREGLIAFRTEMTK